MKNNFVYILSEPTKFKDCGDYYIAETLGIFSSFEEGVKELSNCRRTLCKMFLNKTYSEDEWTLPSYCRLDGQLYINNDGKTWVPL